MYENQQNAYPKFIIMGIMLVILIMNMNLLLCYAETNDANYSATLSIPKRRIEQKDHQITISFQIEGYGYLNEILVVVSSDYGFLRLDTFNITVMKTIANTTKFKNIVTNINKKTLTSWAEVGIGNSLATNYPQAIGGYIKLDLNNQVPIGTHKIKISLIGRTGNNTYYFSDVADLEVVDMWGANPVLLPLLTFVLGLVSGLVLLAIGRYLDKDKYTKVNKPK